MKLRKILSTALAAVIVTSTLAAATITSGAVTISGTKFAYNNDGNVTGILSVTGNLYTYDGELNKVLVAKDVENVMGNFYFKKSTLYSIATKKSALTKVEKVIKGNFVAKTTSGALYYLGDKAVKLPISKKTYNEGLNGDGNAILYTTENGWRGSYYWVAPDGSWIMYVEVTNNGENRVFYDVDLVTGKMTKNEN